MSFGILVTSERALGDLPSREYVDGVLATSPLDPVLRLFTHILHKIELASNPMKEALELLRMIVRDETFRGVLREATGIWSNGRQAVVFSSLLLIDFLKDAILLCKAPVRALSIDDMDKLVRVYLATHDHYQAALTASGRSAVERMKEDVLRQILVGLGDPPTLSLPRYWALWITIPKQLRLVDRLTNYLPPDLPRPISSSIWPLLSLWAFFGQLARTNDSRPATLSREGWNPDVLTRIETLTSQISLEAAEYARELANERSQLTPGERWEYSFLTTSRRPLMRIEDRYFCISLALMANLICEGLYHRMFEATDNDATKVNDLTSIFGQLFECYVRNLWERIVDITRFHKLTAGGGAEEIGDGIIAIDGGIIIYDAKSRRQPLRIVRSGDQEAFFADLNTGVLNGARQLDASIRKLREGRIDHAPENLNFDHIFPIIVTAGHFPEVRFVYDRIDEILTRENLLKGSGISPLLVIDVLTLEIMEGLQEGGSDAVALLLEKASIQERRAQRLDDRIFSERGELPWPSRLRNTLREMGECALEWARSGDTEEERVDRIFLTG